MENNTEPIKTAPTAQAQTNLDGIKKHPFGCALRNGL